MHVIIIKTCLVLMYLALGWAADDASNHVIIKIVDSPHPNRNHQPSTHNSNKILQLRGPPAPMSGPPHLHALAGECFTTKHKNYLYNVCPFHNVTQKEETYMWNRFHGVLGVWREWVIEDDRFVGMLYTLGEKCGRTDREAKIMFKCSVVTKLTNITEPRTCKYVIWMWTPLACFKGAMQVYRVLTSHEINLWDQLDAEYHNQLITRQGLLKKRRELLLSAGLYYNFTQDEQLNLQEQHTKIIHHYSPSTPASPSCQSNLQKLEKELQGVKTQLENYQRAFSLDPSLESRINYLVNVTNKTAINSSSLTTETSQGKHVPSMQQVAEHERPIDQLPVHPPSGPSQTTFNNEPVHLDQPDVGEINNLQVNQLEPDGT